MNIHLKLEKKPTLGNVIRFITCPIMSFFQKKISGKNNMKVKKNQSHNLT